MSKKIFSILLISLGLFLGGCLDSKTDFDAINEGMVHTQYKPLEKQLLLSNKEGFNSDGKKFALFFFTTTCGVCKEQIPILQEITKDKEIKIYGVVSGVGQKQKAEKFLEQNHITLPTFYEPSAVSYLSNLVGGVMGVPVIFFFNEKGEKVTRFLGLTPKSVLQKTIVTL